MLFVSAVPVRRLPVGEAAGAPRVRGQRRSPLLDRTYLTAAALNAVMTMQFSMLTVGVPLWITGWTSAPTVTVAGLLALAVATGLPGGGPAASPSPGAIEPSPAGSPEDQSGTPTPSE